MAVSTSSTFVYLMTNLRCHFISTLKTPAALKQAMGLILMSNTKNGDTYRRMRITHKMERSAYMRLSLAKYIECS